MRKKLTLEEFIERANEIHNNKYDYSKSKYVNVKTKVCVICPIHGEFYITPNHHLSGIGCPKCSGRLKTNEEIISQFVNVHGNKYDYSKVEYKGSTIKVCIICPQHGEFLQRPSDHLSGYGCPRCRSLRMNTESFIQKAREIHDDKYDYSITEYDGCRKHIKIKCNKHGIFEQMPYKHLQGHGCPYCQNSILEEKVAKELGNNNIEYVWHCGKKHLKWLGKQHLDFYLPKYNLAIECQGIQHFEPIEFFGGEEKFKYRSELDEKKKELCKQNNINLIYLDYKTSDTNDLMKVIQNETSIYGYQVSL